MKLSELIREAWENACDNGYEEELREMDAGRLTDDFMDYDCYIAEFDYDDVLREVILFMNGDYK